MSALVRARGQIMFLIGLVLASAVVFWLNGLESVPASDIEPASALVYTPPAQVAASWSWFEKNTDETTGLLRSNRDTGHLLRATLAAHRLGMINGRELYHRLDRTLEALESRTPAPDPVLVSALELIAWSYPANSGEAVKVLEKLRTTRSSAPSRRRPGGATAGSQGQRASGAPGIATDLDRAPEGASDASRHADVLVSAAIRKRGEK